MEAHVMPSQPTISRRTVMPAIRWGAVIAGTVAGLATYLLLNLLGIAVGLTAIDPTAAEPIGAVPLGAAIWNGISMLVAAFIGAYVASRMSGLARRSDGMLHGLVTWATTMVLFAWMATSAIGNLVGGAFTLLGQGAQAGAQATTQDGGGLTERLGALITGSPGADVSGENLAAVRERLEAGDRQGAINYMTSQMGFTEERATSVVDNVMPYVGPGGEQRTAEAAETAVNTASVASWTIFIVILLALGISLWGGLMGSRATSERTLGDHTDERHFRSY